jgi:hypothetical protein
MDRRKVVALSGSSKETAAYGASIGQRLRHIANKDTLKSASFGVTEIHYLPGWHKRRDRHAIAAVVTRLRRQKRGEPLIERDIIRLQDGRFVDNDYRGPELDAVAETQKAQIDGLRQMSVREQALEDFRQSEMISEGGATFEDDGAPTPAEVTHLPQTMTAEEVAEETGTEVDTDEFLSFLDGGEKT